MKVNIIGTFFGSTGYDIHTRSLANALEDEGIEISLTTQRPSQWERMITDKELKMLSRSPEEAEVNLLIGTPPFWKYHLSENKKFIGFVVWEGDKIPVGWLDILLDKRVSQIWVPSTHTYSAILLTAGREIGMELMKKIRIVPHGVDLTKFYPKLEPHEKFTFVFNGGWPQGSKDRKGLSFLLKAYLEEFTSKDNIKMLVKINSAYGMNDQILNKNMAELNIQNTDKPELNFVFDNLQYDVLNKFYNNGDVFVISSLAEGFHLGGIEAMACGLPVLSTDYGGQTDYVKQGINGWLLKDGKMIDVEWDNMYEGIQWKKPSIKELRENLRKIYNMDRETIKDFSKCALITASGFTWKDSAKKAQLFLNEII